MLDVRFRNGRHARQGRGRRSPRRCRHGDTFFFAGHEPRGRADRYRGSDRPRDQPAGAHPDLWRRAHAAVDQSRRPGARLSRRRRPNGRASPTTCANGWRCRRDRSVLPQPGAVAGRDLPARGAALHGRLQLRGLERAPVARHAAHAADGDAGAASRSASSPTTMRSPPIRSSRSPIRRRCSRPTSWRTSSSTGCRDRTLLKRAFREVAVIGGLVERQHPGKRKTGQAGDLLDRPDLRRAAQIRARPSAARRPPGPMRARG